VLLVDPLEDQLEVAIVGLGDGILRAEPQIHLLVQRVGEACLGKAFDGRVEVVDALDDARSFELLDRVPHLIALVTREDELSLTRPGHAILHVLVHITIGVPAHDDRLRPAPDRRCDVPDQYRLSEDRAVQYLANGAVGALPLLL